MSQARVFLPCYCPYRLLLPFYVMPLSTLLCYASIYPISALPLPSPSSAMHSRLVTTNHRNSSPSLHNCVGRAFHHYLLLLRPCGLTWLNGLPVPIAISSYPHLSLSLSLQAVRSRVLPFGGLGLSFKRHTPLTLSLLCYSFCLCSI